MFGFLRRRKPEPAPNHLPITPPHDDVLLIVWRAVCYGPTPAAPDVVAADMGLTWTDADAKEWARHCRRCVSCGAWMYDPLTDHCSDCWEW